MFAFVQFSFYMHSMIAALFFRFSARVVSSGLSKQWQLMKHRIDHFIVAIFYERCTATFLAIYYNYMLQICPKEAFIDGSWSVHA